MADQTDDQLHVLEEDAAHYILASVVAPKASWAIARHRRVVSTARHLGWATIASAVVAIAAFGIESRFWPVVASLMGMLAMTRLWAGRILARSARGLTGLATMERSLRCWLTTTPVSQRDRIDVLELCDLSTDAVLLQSVGPFDRRLPSSARLPSARALAKSIVVDSDWRPNLPMTSTARSPTV